MFWGIRRHIEILRLKSRRVFAGSNLIIGPGGRIWAPKQLIIGNNVSLGSYVRIECDGYIGDEVLIANNVGIIGKNDHAINEVGVSVRYSSWVGNLPEELSLTTSIGSDTWIGYGVTILSGVEIGDSCVIGAGSLVTHDIPSNSIAVGAPAKVIGSRFLPEIYETHWQKLRTKGVRTISEIIDSIHSNDLFPGYEKK